jgi:uncharacterized phage protein gp47/JayE
MTILTTKNFTTLVQQWAAVVQASVASTRPTLILSFTKGAVLRAIAEAQGSVSLWLQGLILKLLTATRLSTSQGVDVDTWCSDFMPGAVGGLALPNGAISPRLPANAATGLVTFARNTPTNPATVSVGAIMQSADGTQTFVVIADATNGAYLAALNGFVIPAAVLSLQVPVQFHFPVGYVPGQYTGPVGNVQAAGITVLQTGISGVDTVTNVAPFTNGFNSESDAALKIRFALYIQSLRAGTEGAIGYAVLSVQNGMQYQIYEPGISGFTILTVFVDDGSGAIPSAVLTKAQIAAQAVRAAGVMMAVYPATILGANVTMSITSAVGYYHPTVVAQVVAAIGLYINGLGLGNPLSFMRLAQVAFDASPGVIDVTGYSLNGAQADLIPGAGKTIKIATNIVS